MDLWGCIRNRNTGAPWLEDTMVIMYSATKGLAAMALAVAHSRGWLDYEAPIASYWALICFSHSGVIGFCIAGRM